MDRLDKTLKVSEDTLNSLNQLNENFTFLVIAEGWCGDAAQIVPILNKIAESSSHIDLKIVLRNEHRWLQPKANPAHPTTGLRLQYGAHHLRDQAAEFPSNTRLGTVLAKTRRDVSPHQADPRRSLCPHHRRLRQTTQAGPPNQLESKTVLKSFDRYDGSQNNRETTID